MTVLGSCLHRIRASMHIITQGFGLMKYVRVFPPFGVALRSKSAPGGLVTGDFLKEWNNSVYC